MTEYYYEYKEGDNTYSDVIFAPSEHHAHKEIQQLVKDIPWSTIQSGQAIGLVMFTHADQLEDIDQYKYSEESPFSHEDWQERIDRETDMIEDNDNIIHVTDLEDIGDPF